MSGVRRDFPRAEVWGSCFLPSIGRDCVPRSALSSWNGFGGRRRVRGQDRVHLLQSIDVVTGKIVFSASSNADPGCEGDVMPGLPERPDFDQLRRQARELLRAAVSGDPAALLRLRAVSERITLADAQLAIAREHGFTSWAHMKREVAGRGAGGLAGPGQGARSAAERYL